MSKPLASRRQDGELNLQVEMKFSRILPSHSEHDGEEDFAVRKPNPHGASINHTMLRNRRIIHDNDSSDEDNPVQTMANKEDEHKQEFVLPDQNYSSSSDSEEDNPFVAKVPHHETQRSLQNVARMRQAEAHHYDIDDDDDDDELLNAAFFSTHREHQPTKRRLQVENDYNDKENQHSQDSIEVVDLCGDSDNGGEQPAIFRQGLRVPSRSPRFNMMEREIAVQSGAYATGRQLDHIAKAVNPASPVIGTTGRCIDNDDDDDIVECWSSDEENNFGKSRISQRPRRVTDIFVRPAPLAQSFQSAPQRGHIDTANKIPRQQVSNTTTSAAVLPSRWRLERSDRRRKLRDATNTSLARAVVPKNPAEFEMSLDTTSDGRSNDRTPYVQTNRDVWYRNAQPYDTAHATLSRNIGGVQRNDLRGGSGVGVGSYAFQSDSGAPNDDLEEEQPTNRDAAPRSAAAGTRKRASKSTTKRPSSRGAGRKKSWGGGRGRKSWSGGRGKGKTKGSWNSNKGTRPRKRSGADQPYMEISRQDPQLKHVGGANIEF